MSKDFKERKWQFTIDEMERIQTEAMEKQIWQGSFPGLIYDGRFLEDEYDEDAQREQDRRNQLERKAREDFRREQERQKRIAQQEVEERKKSGWFPTQTDEPDPSLDNMSSYNQKQAALYFVVDSYGNFVGIVSDMTMSWSQKRIYSNTTSRYESEPMMTQLEFSANGVMMGTEEATAKGYILPDNLKAKKEPIKSWKNTNDKLQFRPDAKAKSKIRAKSVKKKPQLKKQPPRKGNKRLIRFDV